MEKAFSIVIPTYNCAHTLGRALDSALAQDLATGDYEVIVVDDGSSDDTATILADYRARFPGARLKCLAHDGNHGVARARNSGTRVASGAYVVYLDADDMLAPDALSRFETGLREARGRNMEDPLLASAHCTLFADRPERMVVAPVFSGRAAHNFRRHINGTKRVAVCGSYALPRRFYARHRFPEQLPTAEDFVYVGWALAQLEHLSIAQVTAYIHRRAGSRRSSVALSDTIIDDIVRELFDRDKLPAALLGMACECRAALHLSASRRRLRAGCVRAGLRHWLSALRTRMCSALAPRWIFAIGRLTIAAILGKRSQGAGSA